MLILISAVTVCVSIFAFTSLVCVPVGITSSAVELNIFAIIAGMKMCKSITKKKKKKHDKILVLGKDKLNIIKVLIFNALIDSRHDEFVSINNVSWNEKRNKKSGNFLGINYIKTMETFCISCKKYTAKENSSVEKTEQNTLMLLSGAVVIIKNRLLLKINNF